eukprot:gene29333-36510_t
MPQASQPTPAPGVQLRAPNENEAGVGSSRREGKAQAPPMLRQGGSAFEAIRRKKEERKRLKEELRHSRGRTLTAVVEQDDAPK